MNTQPSPQESPPPNPPSQSLKQQRSLENPYFEEYRRLLKRSLKTSTDWIKNGATIFQKREELRKKYSFAIPNKQAIQVLVDHSPIIEIGAGNGYWASLIKAAGGEIQAFDKNVENNPYRFSKSHFPVQQGSEKILLKTPRPFSLFLCWPPLNNPMAQRALEYFKGKRVLYLGEPQGGCTANEEFHLLLQEEWDLIKSHRVPQWPSLHDQLYIYERKL